ncbi:MAG: O-antigen ligase family protein [Planctomycetales bacterium]|nr:O-antigen ligase family protein [Planctomycetales bacterium]
MPFLALTIAAPLLLWVMIALLRGSIFLSTALFFVATCVFPAEFYAVDALGLTWTLDRIWLVGIAGQFAIRWYRDELRFTQIESTDVAMVLFGLWLVARTLTQPLGSVLPGQPPTLMHLVNGYMIPFFLYLALRTSRLEPARMQAALWVVSGLGIYLGLTALLEAAKLWGLVFPRFIGDPTLGIHFGRARGPMLQSVRLGISLLACMVPLVVYTLWLKPDSRWSWVVALLSLPLVFAAIFVTYTRSVWLGLAFVTLTLVTLCLQGIPRRAALFGMLSAALAVGIIKGPELVAFKREFSAAETRESTYMRAAFAYVSIEMFKDRPLAGFGFNQFQIYNRPYLADRSTNIRLESIRGYVHHNSFLSLLVDLGLIGFALYAFLGLSSAIQMLLLWQCRAVPPWARGLSLVGICIGGVHLLQMAFHEVSFSTIENSFLFAAIGLVVAAKQQFGLRGPAGLEHDREANLRSMVQASQP